MRTRTLSLLVVVLLTGSVALADLKGLFNAAKAVQDVTKVVDTTKDISKASKILGIGPKEEADIGDSVSLELIGKYGGLVRDEEIMRRVNLVGGTLARYSGRPERDWRFGVLNSDTVNAFSAPDGYVFITRGLYDLATDDNLLAGILAHEIAHITERHALKIVERDEAFSGAKSFALKRSGDVREFQSKVNQADAYLSVLGQSTGKVLKTLVETGFDSKTEYAADQTGHDLAAQAGYTPGGLRATLVMLQARKGDQKKIFSTHPPLKERIKRLPDEPAPGA